MMLLTGVVAGYGGNAVAAFGVAARIQTMVLIVPLSISAAISPFVGMNLGARQVARANKGVTYATRLALAWGGIAWLALALTARPVGELFSREPDVARLYAACMPILALSFAPGSFIVVLGSALNAAKLAGRSTLLSFLRGIGLSLPLALLGGALFGFEGIFFGVVLGNLITVAIARFWTGRQFWRRESDEGQWRAKAVSENP